MLGYKLHLIRHGITEGNLKGLYQGSGTDLPLCEQGEDQLLGLKERFRYPPVEKLYVSPLKRAVQTAELIYPLLDYEFVSDLTECNFGDYEGKTIKELLRQDPDFPRWLDPKSGYCPKGGESSRDFTFRCVKAVDYIFNDMMRNGIREAAAVTHGGVICTVMAAVAFPQKPAPAWTCDNGCGYTLFATTQMWSRDRAAQAYDIVPIGYDFSQSRFNRFKRKKEEDGDD